MSHSKGHGNGGEMFIKWPHLIPGLREPEPAKPALPTPVVEGRMAQDLSQDLSVVPIPEPLVAVVPKKLNKKAILKMAYELTMDEMTYPDDVKVADSELHYRAIKLAEAAAPYMGDAEFAAKLAEVKKYPGRFARAQSLPYTEGLESLESLEWTFRHLDNVMCNLLQRKEQLRAQIEAEESALPFAEIEPEDIEAKLAARMRSEVPQFAFTQREYNSTKTSYFLLRRIYLLGAQELEHSSLQVTPANCAAYRKEIGAQIIGSPAYRHLPMEQAKLPTGHSYEAVKAARKDPELLLYLQLLALEKYYAFKHAEKSQAKHSGFKR